MKKTVISYNEWRAALEEINQKKADRVPSGWITAAQFSEMSGYGKSHAHDKLARLIKNGRVERKRFCVWESNGRLQSPYHYRLVKKNEKNRPQAA